MTKCVLTLSLFLISSTLYCQKLSLEIRDYDQMILDLKSNGKGSRYYNNLDLDAILYLDKSCLILLLEIDENFLSEFNLDTLNYSPPGINLYTKYFKTSCKDVKSYFLDKKESELLKNYLLDQDNDNFNPDSPIYIKDSTIAFFSNGSKTYRIALAQGQLKTELLSQTIE